MNLANKLYLGFIIFYGMLVFYTFGLRIIDKTPFYSSINKIYPKGVLLCSGLFLVSCNISAFVDEKNSTPILLMFSSFTAVAVAVGILYLLSRRSENSSDVLPGRLFLLFGSGVAANSFWALYYHGNQENVEGQVISGVVILVAALMLILYLVHKQNEKTEKITYYYIIVNKNEDFLEEKDILEKISIQNKNIEIHILHSAKELAEWVSNIDTDLFDNTL